MAARTKHTSQATKVAFLVRLTITGIIVYVCIDVLLAYLRPDNSLLHNAESDYGRGPYFWLMDINFMLRCFFSLALVRALLVRFPNTKLLRPACYCLALWAIASGLLAFFADNPRGYAKLASGSVHVLLAFIAFISVMVAMILVARLWQLLGFSRTIGKMLVSLTVISAVSLVLLGHAGIRPHTFGGLYERLFLGSILLWEGTLAYALLTHRTQKV